MAIMARCHFPREAALCVLRRQDKHTCRNVCVLAVHLFIYLLQLNVAYDIKCAK